MLVPFQHHTVDSCDCIPSHYLVFALFWFNYFGTYYLPPNLP